MVMFALRRTLQAIPLVLFISMLIFSILEKAPGGPLAPYLQKSSPYCGRCRQAQT